MSQTYVPTALRKLVRERAQDCCEYCRLPESVTFAPHWIDHIIAEKHGGKTDADNLAYSCVVCNQAKGSDLTSIDPLSGAIVPLFHPRRNRWTDHFQMVDGKIDALTPIGRVTVGLLKLNDPERIEERQQLVALGILGPRPAP
jgi:hypothetical protein